MKHLIAPSLLSADFLNLQRDIEMINRSEADWLHLDVMDGVFVPNITIGIPVLQAIGRLCQKKMDVHLMIVEPQKFIPELAACGTYMMNVHYETCPHLHRTVHAIREAGMKAGVALNPHTPVSLLVEKTRKMREMIDRRGLQTLIQVDGGVNLETGRRLLEAGADVLVAGSFVFKSGEPEKTIRELKELTNS